MLPLFISMYMCQGRVNVAPLITSTLCSCSAEFVGGSMLPVFMSMCQDDQCCICSSPRVRRSQCCLCSRPCVRMVNVASVCVCVRGRWWVIVTSVHVNVYVLGGQFCLCSCPCIGGQCCLCSCPCVCAGGAGVIVASVHFHVHVLGKEGSMQPLFISIYMCQGRVNVGFVHAHVY